MTDASRAPSGEFFDAAPCGFIETDARGTINRVNRTFLQWTGYQPAVLQGAPILDVFTRPCQILYETHIRPLLSTQGFVNEMSIDVRLPTGESLPVLANFVQDARGDGASGRVALFRALHRRSYEDELLRVARAGAEAKAASVSDIATMGHEVRSALNVIIGAAELLASSRSPADQNACLAVLGTSSESLLTFVNRLLHYSRLERGAWPVEAEPFDVAQTVSALVTEWSVMARAKNLTLHLDVDPEVPRQLTGDRIILRQALSNLIANGIKFTAAGFVLVSVAVCEVGERSVTLEFRVVDTGDGISEDARAGLFEEFQQGRLAGALKHHGDGLGLAIARKLVQLLGGDIRIATDVGNGTSFWFQVRFATSA